MKRRVLRWLRISRPTTAERQRQVMEDGVRAGMEYIVRRYGEHLPTSRTVHWYDR
jgi:hypothetical protein